MVKNIKGKITKIKLLINGQLINTECDFINPKKYVNINRTRKMVKKHFECDNVFFEYEQR